MADTAVRFLKPVMGSRSLARGLLLIACVGRVAFTQTPTPVTGHYPPGQSGIRGASTPDPGLSYTNFSRFFTNLQLAGASERRRIFTSCAMRTSACSRGRRTGSSSDCDTERLPESRSRPATSPNQTGESGFGLGDILLTPLSLYGKSALVRLPVPVHGMDAVGKFLAGVDEQPRHGLLGARLLRWAASTTRADDRDAWSISAVARIEQNFEQRGSGITPGDDIVVDWGIGRMFRAWRSPTRCRYFRFRALATHGAGGRSRRESRAALPAPRSRTRSQHVDRRSARRFAFARTGSSRPSTSCAETISGSSSTTDSSPVVRG